MLFTVASKKRISLMFLVRHGETRSNVEHRYHGQLDSPLTQRGIAQAHAIGRHLATVLGAQSVEIVSSPQPRALRTAELIRHHLSGVESLRTDDRLCEVSIGDWEGLNHDEIIALAAGVFDGDGRWEWCFQAPGGETYEAFAGRVGEFLCDINSAQSQSLIVVSHGILSRVLRGLYAGLPRLLALTLPIPQDRIYRLSGGNIEEIKVHGDLRAPRIVRAQPLPGLRLFVEFDDGVSGPAEIIDFIDTESAQRLRDETLYRQVLIDDFGAVRWITGGVLAPDALYEHLRNSPNSRIKSCF
jgi:broad specificity phosphatase PhoE